MKRRKSVAETASEDSEKARRSSAAADAARTSPASEATAAPVTASRSDCDSRSSSRAAAIVARAVAVRIATIAAIPSHVR